MTKTSIFKIKLIDNKKISRKIEISNSASLAKLAETILKAYDFWDLAHCYGFYSDIADRYRRYHDSEKRYELFVDIGETDYPSGDKRNALSVRLTKIKEVWPKIGDKMMFLFDYGDDWRFIVEKIGEGEKDKNKKYPLIFDKKGESPEQYPEWEEPEDISEDSDFTTMKIPQGDSGMNFITEYFKFHDFIPYNEKGEIDSEQISRSAKALENNKTNLKEKKIAIITLGHIGKKEALEILEKNLDKTEGELKFWLEAAIGECMLFLDASRE